jgi:hypothetical protein
MAEQDSPKNIPLAWLLESESPGARYLALRDLAGCAPGDRELLAARRAAHREGPIAGVLAEMNEDGHWVDPGPGYRPKYRSSVWSLILLAQLGARVEEDERIARACAYMLDHALLPGGQFTAEGTPSTTIDCLQGNLCYSLLELGCGDPRLDAAYDWMARTVTGEGIAPASERDAPVRYYAYKCGPLFACGANNTLPCAWGAAKVLLAFGRLPVERRTPNVEQAIEVGVASLLGTDPALADYPCPTGKPSGNWWKFGFPVFYVTDILQVVEALVSLGHGADPRLANALDLIRGKQDERGRWALEYDYAGKIWVDLGAKKEPSKWVTLRALRALRRACPGMQSDA